MPRRNKPSPSRLWNNTNLKPLSPLLTHPCPGRHVRRHCGRGGIEDGQGALKIRHPHCHRFWRTTGACRWKSRLGTSVAVPNPSPPLGFARSAQPTRLNPVAPQLDITFCDSEDPSP